MNIIIPLILLLISVKSFGVIINPINAIYGIDDRQFITKKSNPQIQILSKSVGLIVSSDLIEKRKFNSLINSQKLTKIENANLCLEEKFSNHQSVNACTGFLISDDVLITAGHCFINQSDCENKSIIFDVFQTNEKNKGIRIANSNIFKCSKILSSKFDSNEVNLIDYSIIKLDRKTIGRPSLKLSTSEFIEDSEKVFMIGHPLGMPMMHSQNAKITENTNEHFFRTQLDSFEGNSGSPVFNSKTFEVEGLLVRGEEDFLFDDVKQCYHLAKYKEDDLLKGESVNRINDVILDMK